MKLLSLKLMYMSYLVNVQMKHPVYSFKMYQNVFVSQDTKVIDVKSWKTRVWCLDVILGNVFLKMEYISSVFVILDILDLCVINL